MPGSSYQIGLLAEFLCLLRLWCGGWRVLARRYKTPQGEIDLIVRRGRVIAFVEVKSRKSRDAALACISKSQQQRIIRAAHHWLAAHGEFAGFHLRFDIMWVTGWPWPGHLAGAWLAEE
jgi:putative endonuclease